MKNILILICFSILIIGCEKEKIVEVEVIKEIEYNWKSHSDFVYNDVVQMNSYATNNNLFFLGHNSFSSMFIDSLNNPNLPFGGNVVHYNLWYEQPSDRKLPICEDYFISYNNSNGLIAFIPSMNPVTMGTSISFSLQSIDSTYAYFDFIHFSNGECIAINDKNQSLIPYISLVDLENVLKLALIDIKTEFITNLYYLDTLAVNVLSIKDEYQFHVIALESVGSYFYLTTNSKVYRIDTYGNIESVLSTRLNRIVESSGKIYGLGSDNIYISSDNGLTWSQGNNIQNYYS